MFDLNNIFQINKENQFTLIRAAEISTFLSSSGPTIGPNSTALDLECSLNDLSITNGETKEKSEKPLKPSNRRSSGNRLDVSDIMYLHDRMHQENERRRINTDLLK
jgi:hypothetical protein